MVALGLLLLAGQAAAQSGLPHGERTSSPDKVFSTESPCSSAVSELLKLSAPEMLTQAALSAQSSVVCATSQLFFVAGTIEHDTGKEPLFDHLQKKARAESTDERTHSMVTIAGRRAFLNRQVASGRMAQSGFVELGDRKVVLLIAGGRPGTGLGIEEQAKDIDRFYQSLRFPGL